MKLGKMRRKRNARYRHTGVFIAIGPWGEMDAS